MKISLYLDALLENERFSNLFAFLLESGIAPNGAQIHPTGPMAQQEIPAHPAFTLCYERHENPKLEIGFLNNEKNHNKALVKNHHLPKLLVGTEGLPLPLKRVWIPFETRRFAKRWLHPVLTQARHFGWPASLLYCERSLVTNEISRLADWFHLDSVKNAMSEWLCEDTRAALSDLIADFPDVEVNAGIGRVSKILGANTNGRSVFMVGSLKSGYHLPNRHHGLDYGKLLTQSRGSGYFLAE